MRQESELRPYQQRIATFLYENDEALCVVRPGGGKTIAALTAIRELKLHGVIRQALIIAPKRVAENVWPDEVLDWAHTTGLSFALLAGTKAQREKALYDSVHTDLVIVGLDNVEWLLDQLIECEPDDHIYDLLVIDEISKLRGPTGVRAKLLAKHASRWKMIWGLSGTLRPNGPLDLFMPARVVTRGRLWGKSFYGWRQQRFYPTDRNQYNWVPMPGAEVKLTEEIAPLIVSLREDEYPQLPALSVVLDHIELPDKARRMYIDMHRKLVAAIGADKRVTAANAAVATGKLAQIANGFLYPEQRQEQYQNLGSICVHDEKRDWLADVIESATGSTILIYEYQRDLEMMRELVPGLRWIGAGADDTAIALWNRGELPFMALHPAAGGHGLNLQAGGCDMAWLAPTWSPEMWEQTIARLHRSGQTRPVIVRVCVARGTVDEMKLDRVHYKISAQKAFEKYLASCEQAS